MKPKIAQYNKNPKPERNLRIESKKNSGNSKSNLYFIISAIVVCLILFFVSYLNYLKKPANAEGDFKYFEIKQGTSTYTIGKQLKKEELVRSPLAFYVFSKSTGKSVQAGYYKVSPKMNLSEIINKFISGDIDALSVTIPEGYRVLQIAKLLEKEGEIDANAFIASAIGTEGTLFPDTYVFVKNIETAKIVRQMKENYEKRTEDMRVSDDDLILASIVEREAKSDDERAKIAAIYQNRLDKNMLLQADPTVRYTLDSQKYLETESVDFDFWTLITKADYQNTQSAFNTYKQRGLPPAPICNPGLKSIEAALNPEKDLGYLFFFHDENQKIRFSNTYEEHLRQIQEFGVSS